MGVIAESSGPGTTRIKTTRFFLPRKKTLLLSMKYWLVNRDPYNGLLCFIILPI